MRLRQVLIDLVGNAIKFTDEGSVRLTTRFLAEAPQSMLEFEVADTGIGMSPDQLERVFQPFSQAQDVPNRHFGGTGLGLTISECLVGMLGGAIEVRSESGKDSTFTVTVATGPLEGIPLVEPALSEPAADDESIDKPSPETISGCRVLVADDRRDNRHLISRFLQAAGADVVEVEDGQEAIEAHAREQAAGRPFHLILMDMQMPILDGYETTAKLRESGCTTPIIALTASAMTEDRDECLAAGCDNYMAKPIDRNALIELVASHFRAV